MRRIPFLLVLCAGLAAEADTFRHKTTGQVYHGYAYHDAVDGKTTVITRQSGRLELNMADFTVAADAQGRNRIVPVFTLDDEIAAEIVAAAFEKAIIEESNKGPLFIAIEIDSPGGRIDLAMRICSAITTTHNCTVVSFVKGGPNGGAYSAAAAVALACDKIYMSGGTVIGAATVVVESEKGIAEIEKVAGKTVGEKIRSAWRNYLASLAEQSNRPVALARAMEDKDIEVLQVKRNDDEIFIETSEKQPSDEIIRIRNRKGQLVTLPAQEAVECRMADKVVNSIADVLVDCDAADAKIERPDNLARAREELDKVIRKFKQLDNSLDTRFKTIVAKSRSGGMTKIDAAKSFKAIIQEIKYLIKLKQLYPDVPYDQEDLQEVLNSIQAEYESVKSL